MELTKEEARVVIECMLTDMVGEYADKEMPIGVKRTFDALETAEEALEKQMPKKPSHRIHANIFHCGNDKECDANFSKVSDKHSLFRYCPFCGQAIDWSEVE